jgi:GWxTD domain-containing protein
MKQPSRLAIRVFLLVMMLSLLSSLVVGQNPAPTNPQERPRKPTKAERNGLDQWAEQDVAPIITPEELQAWKKLKTSEEREAFAAEFWRRRDPDPDTEENEYREGYYERLAYVNERFSAGRPGYLTDRGRIYLVWGKPDEVETHPTGGTYQQPAYQSGQSVTTYPFEIWFYRYLPNVGSGLELEFVDRSGSGDYRLASDYNEKNVAGFTNAGNISSGAIGSASYTRPQDNPIDVMLRNVALSRPPAVAPNGDLRGPDSGIVDNNDQIGVELRVDMFRQSDRSSIAAIMVQTANSDLSFPEIGGVPTARLNIFGRVMLVNNRQVATFQDSVTATASTSELLTIKSRRSAYQKILSLPPGTYKVNITVRDLNSSAVGFKSYGFTIAQTNGAQLNLSSIVLASRLEELGSRPQGQMFTIGDKKVVPNISGEFHRGQGIGLYAQLYNAETDQTTLRPAVEVTYAILRNGVEVMHQGEDWSGMSEAGARLTLARVLPTTALTPGTYQLVINVKDQVSGATLTQAANFTLLP